MKKGSLEVFKRQVTYCTNFMEQDNNITIETALKIFDEFPMNFRNNIDIIREIVSSISREFDLSLTSDNVKCVSDVIFDFALNNEDLTLKTKLYDKITYSNYKPGDIGFDEFQEWKKTAVKLLKSGVKFTYKYFFKTSIDTMRFVMDLGIDFLEETDHFEEEAILHILKREDYLEFIDFLSEKGIRIFHGKPDEYDKEWSFSNQLGLRDDGENDPMSEERMYSSMKHLLEKPENDINFVPQNILKQLLEITSSVVKDYEKSVKRGEENLQTKKKILKEYYSNLKKRTKLLNLFDSNIKKRRLPLLRKSIKESFNKKEFVWQDVCSQLNKEGIEYLKKIANELLIVDVEGKNKRELCKLISNEMMDAVESCEDTNLFGDELNKLPGWRIYKIKSKCYDILDLKNIIDSGETRNPFTREKLPVEDIKQRIKLLINIKGTGTLDSKNFLKDVKESQIFSMETYLTQQIVKLYSKFPYMLEPTLVSLATDEEINQMIEDVFQTDANDVFKVTSQEIRNLRRLSGTEKKIKFIELLVRLTEYDNKTNLLYLAFLYFSKIKKGQDTTDDLFYSITGYEDEDEDED
jgi:hypothetical protein